MRRSPVVPLLVILALLLAGGAGIAAVSGGMRSAREVAYEGNARRFLDLTDPDHAAGTIVPGSTAETAATDYDGPGEGNYTPAGWRVRPAGKQVPVLNFPLGLTVTPDHSSVLVSSDSGGLQGITRISSSTLAPTHYPAQNLFMGLAATPEGRVYASGGNADRVFRYRLSGALLVPLDLTEVQPFPLHATLDQVLDQLPESPTLPLTDGIRVRDYPGNSVVDGPYLYVAGTLSEPSGAGADACPGARPKCARVTVIDTRTDAVVARAPVGSRRVRPRGGSGPASAVRLELGRRGGARRRRRHGVGRRHHQSARAA